MRLFLAAIAALLAGALGGCDFTPTLDVPLPDFAPALTLNGVLTADSTVTVRITAADDPYANDDRYDAVFAVPDGVQAELVRDGAPLGPLRLVSETCDDPTYNRAPDDPQPTYECGSFVSDAVIEPGRTYTLRASAPGFPDAHATVTVPVRVAAAVTVGATAVQPLPPDGKRFDTDLALTVRDPAGTGQRYGLLVIREPYSYDYSRPVCIGGHDNPTCRDTTVTVRVDPATVGYTTTDPILLAGARTVPSSGIDFISFADDAFDGEARTFALRAQQFWYPSYSGGEPDPPVGVWLVVADRTTYDARQIAWFSGGGDNPFSEPVDLPSNVVGGYGLLGAIAITEARIPE